MMERERTALVARSSLEPPEGLGALTDAAVPQQGVAMEARRQLLDAGEWLRATDILHGLSIAEATVLGTFLLRCSAAAGETIIHQGDGGDDVYLIEAGQAEVQVRSRGGQRTIVATLGPGKCFGEIALVTAGERTADVIALTPMTLLRLSRDAYARYLAHVVEVDSQLTHTALDRTRHTLRAVRGDEEEDDAANRWQWESRQASRSRVARRRTAAHTGGFPVPKISPARGGTTLSVMCR